MGLSARAIHSIKVFVIVGIAVAMIGALYAATLDFLIRGAVTPTSLLRGATRGILIGLIAALFETALSFGPFGRRLREWPFSAELATRTLASSIVLAGAIILSRSLLSSRGHALEQWLAAGFFRDMVFVLTAAFAVHFVLQMRRLVGGRVLANIVLGRYQRPVQEERIFLFLDVKGSTALAQRLGDLGTHSMITRLFFDIAEPVLRFGGETHRYIGDQVVVTWPLEEGLKDARCLRCYFAVRDMLERYAERYRKDFGVVPDVYVGLHGGPVVAGACGDDKREIVYFGDTVNTAARLEQACREFERPLLISKSLLEQMELPPAWTVERMGEKVLRGQEHPLEIYTVSRRPWTAESA